MIGRKKEIFDLQQSNASGCRDEEEIGRIYLSIDENMFGKDERGRQEQQVLNDYY